MFARFTFLAVAAFWLVMMTLLWRSEFGGQPGSNAIPAGRVWEKIITAPDFSTLLIRHAGTNLGQCRWWATVQEGEPEELIDEDLPADFSVRRVAGYTLDLDGSLTLPDFGRRLSFTVSVQLGTNHEWREFVLTVKWRPEEYHVLISEASQTVRIWGLSAGVPFNQSFRLRDLQNPSALMKSLNNPWLSPLLAGAGLSLPTNTLSRLGQGLQWQARQEWMQVGHTRARVYRVQTTLLDRHRITAFISPVGELLRVDLPFNVRLVNEAFGGGAL